MGVENHLFLLFQASFPPVSLFQPLGTQLYPSSPFVLSCSLHPLSPESTSAFTCTKSSRQDLLLGYPTRDSDPLLWLWLSWPTAAESALPGDCVATIIDGCPCGHRSLAIRAPSSPVMGQILYGFCPWVLLSSLAPPSTPDKLPLEVSEEEGHRAGL